MLSDAPWSFAKMTSTFLQMYAQNCFKEMIQSRVILFDWVLGNAYSWLAAQGSFLQICRKPYMMLGFELGSIVYKANA